MTVFVGWSGSGGREIAKRVKKFLQDFFGKRITVTFSEEIPAGDFWLSSLTRMLKDADYGLLCLVPQSEPAWLLYEAGILSQTTLTNLNENPGPHIAPILFGVDTETSQKFGPLRYYQTYSFPEVMGNLLGNINDVSFAMAEAQIPPAHGYRAPSSLTQDEFDAKWKGLHDAFERDIRRLMKANDLELHLAAFQNEATDGRPLFGLGKTLVSALRMETATPDTRKAAFDKFRETFAYAVSEEGVTLDLKPLQKDVRELQNLLKD